ncbi:MAG TPA: hypothetical protein VK929_05325 [Longimicrobiales bacterium]|nr:hypothetical protein [Longimicrobiales bacterium]
MSNIGTTTGYPASMCTTSSFYRSGSRSPFGGRIYVRVLRLVAMAGLGAALVACAGTAARDMGEADPVAEARAVAATAPTQRLHVIFSWEMRDRDARFNGQGVLRLDDGYRARVDLFGPRGETYAAAIVEDGTMRVVPAGADAMLPPPALLWSVLGVFRPPVDAPLTGTSGTEDGLRLTYQRDGVTWLFGFSDDALRSTEWTARDGRRTVQLSGSAGHRLPAQAAFRDWTEFRELTLRVTDVEVRPSFDADVWILPGQAR